MNGYSSTQRRSIAAAPPPPTDSGRRTSYGCCFLVSKARPWPGSRSIRCSRACCTGCMPRSPRNGRCCGCGWARSCCTLGSIPTRVWPSFQCSTSPPKSYEASMGLPAMVPFPLPPHWMRRTFSFCILCFYLCTTPTPSTSGATNCRCCKPTTPRSSTASSNS